MLEQPHPLDDKVFDHPHYGKCYFVLGRYHEGDRIAIQVRSDFGEPIATLTVNLPEEKLEEGEIFVKTWEENRVTAAAALATGLFEDTGKRVATGFVEAHVWRIK